MYLICLKIVCLKLVREYGIMFPYSGASECISYRGDKFDKVRQMEGMGVLNQILIEINIINDIYTTVYRLWARLSCFKAPVNRETLQLSSVLVIKDIVISTCILVCFSNWTFLKA